MSRRPPTVGLLALCALAGFATAVTLGEEARGDLLPTLTLPTIPTLPTVTIPPLPPPPPIPPPPPATLPVSVPTVTTPHLPPPAGTGGGTAGTGAGATTSSRAEGDRPYAPSPERTGAGGARSTRTRFST